MSLGGLENTTDLHAFIEECQDHLDELHEAIVKTYFV